MMMKSKLWQKKNSKTINLISHFHVSVVVMICVIPLELVVILVKVQYRASDLLPLRCAGGARCSARVTHLVFPDFA